MISIPALEAKYEIPLIVQAYIAACYPFYPTAGYSAIYP